MHRDLKILNRINVLLLALLGLYGCSAFKIPQTASINGLHAPWDGLEDETRFRCSSDEDNFFFYFEVSDSSLTLNPQFESESTVEHEDRVEIFFSPTADMASYWCAEIDPLGRVLDYSAHYPQKMDYGWNFESLLVNGALVEGGYLVWGKVSLKELRQMGIEAGKQFWMGVFRADYRPDLSVNWYSAVSSDDPSPDFHKPNMLFPSIISR